MEIKVTRASQNSSRYSARHDDRYLARRDDRYSSWDFSEIRGNGYLSCIDEKYSLGYFSECLWNTATLYGCVVPFMEQDVVLNKKMAVNFRQDKVENFKIISSTGSLQLSIKHLDSNGNHRVIGRVKPVYYSGYGKSITSADVIVDDCFLVVDYNDIRLSHIRPGDTVQFDISEITFFCISLF